MSFDINNFSGYVLAGGRSSRMGRDKAFLEINGKTFLQNAIEILSPVFASRVKVVLNRQQTHFIEKLPAGIAHIFDIYENRGPLGGIHASFMDCKTKFAVILAVDLPLVKPGLIEALSTRAVGNRADAVVPIQSETGLKQPLCGVYRVASCVTPLEVILKSNL
ncbi:MAG: molybdenum cofactor guanylyltransferase, partial [Acidobacteria bacterium]|nr:molybdenum cofactor guanylyltransferase [Acidobacteriota bacterium]